VPVIKADLTLEEKYAPPSSVAAFPITAVVGTKPGRDQEKSLVSKEAAELWCAATSAPAKKVLTVDTDWYVLQEESGAGVKAVLGEVTSFMGAL
jgi:surfactin synthase thioesterase subunit